jgi:SAM-dependent methyltransferase
MTSPSPEPSKYVQRDQPAGVPPLALTGERTLPDVPAENYWYRRHLAVYRWIAARCDGLRVADMACGEGYGAAVLAQQAQTVIGVDANPEAHEHAVRKYTRPGLSFARALIEEFDAGAPYDAIVFLQTVEHIERPEPLLERFASLLSPGGLIYASTPNRLTLAPAGAPRSDNPWHVREYSADEFGALLAPLFGNFELLGVYHARKLALHAAAITLGWDRVHRVLRVSERFYDWFVPAISESDFAIRRGRLERALDFLAVCRP